jgi:purine-binding chemotaxis protein CheW
VLSIPEAEIVEPPEMSRSGSKYIKGIGKVGNEVKLLLDCDKLLSDDEIDNLNIIQ